MSPCRIYRAAKVKQSYGSKNSAKAYLQRGEYPNSSTVKVQILCGSYITFQQEGTSKDGKVVTTPHLPFHSIMEHDHIKWNSKYLGTMPTYMKTSLTPPGLSPYG